MEPLSEGLAFLAQRAKRAEDDVAAARNEARDKLEARREQLRDDADRTMDMVESGLQRIHDHASSGWAAFTAKLGADRERMRARREQLKRDLKAYQADDREVEAAILIDYAIAAVEQAELAVLDAISARAEAEDAKSEPNPMSAQ